MISSLRGWPLTVSIAVLAFLARLWPVVHGGGLLGLMGYDDGVYYSGAAALVFGRLPYRDFVLLHPPVIVLAITPFAALGRLTSDPVGMAVGRLVFMAVGALNAALVLRIARRYGLLAAVAGGLFYALWFPAEFAERTIAMEPLVNTAILLALLLLMPRGATPDDLDKAGPDVVPGADQDTVREPIRGRGQLLAGVALGVGTATKIWAVVPCLVIIGWQLLSEGRRAALRVTSGAALGAIVVCLPFFLAAPGAMIRMVLLDQVGRPELHISTMKRLASITGISRHFAGVSEAVRQTSLLGALLLCCAVAVCCLARRDARIIGALLVATTTVLLASPVYFLHYAGFVAVPLALAVTVGAATVAAWARTRDPGICRAVLAGALVIVVVPGLHAATFRQGIRFPAARLVAAMPTRGCIVSDVNSTLVLMNVLSRDLRRGCPLMVDFTGRTYDTDARHRPDGTPVSRRHNTVWQQHALQYLTSGSATVLARGPDNGFAPETNATLNRLPVLAHAGRYRLRGR